MAKPSGHTSGRQAAIFSGLTGALLALSLLALSACGSSSDTRNTAKAASSGKYEIFVKIIQPDNGAAVTLDESGGSNVTLVVNTQGGTEPIGITWDVQGPTKRSTDTGKTTQIRLFEYGIHTVNVTAIDANGIRGSDSIKFNVTSDVTIKTPIIATIGSPTDGSTIAFDPVTGETDAQLRSFASGGTGEYAFQWTIKGPTTTNTADGQTVDTVTFFEAGNHVITLTVTDSEGNVGTDTVRVNVNVGGAPGPIVQIIEPAIRRVFALNEAITFSASVTGGSGSYAYLWTPSSSDAATPKFSEAATTVFSFSRAGNYTVRLEVRDIGLQIRAADDITITVR